MRGFWLIVLSFALICCSDSELVTNVYPLGWNENYTLQVGTTQRYFRFYVPVNAPAKPPLVIVLHGGTQSMRKIFDVSAGGSQEWRNVAQEEKFILLAPNGMNGSTSDYVGDEQNWNDCRNLQAGAGVSSANDVLFIDKLIDWAITNLDVDPTRVYVTGASNGGMMTYRVAQELNTKIAACAVFIANQPAVSECPTPSLPMPMMIVNGTEDPLMPYNGGSVGGNNQSTVLSANETLSLWIKANGISATSKVSTALPDSTKTDGSMIIKNVYGASTPAAEIEFYEVVGGGHTMPSINHNITTASQIIVGGQNQDVEGAVIAWNFLKRHSK
jgi:polyhydroxybutyrate depolymerase